MVYAVDAKRLNVTWYPPLIPNGKITHYVVMYCSISTISQGWQSIEVTGREAHGQRIWVESLMDGLE